MFKIGGAVVVHLAGIGLLDVARSSFGPSHVPPFLEDVLEGVPELVAKPEQEYRLVPAENRQLQLPEQVSQPFGGQAEKVVEEGWGHDGGSEKFVVKRSGGFGPATDSRLETDRDKAHLRTRYRVRDHLRGGCTILPWSIVLGMVEHARGERETRRQYNDNKVAGNNETGSDQNNNPPFDSFTGNNNNTNTDNNNNNNDEDDRYLRVKPCLKRDSKRGGESGAIFREKRRTSIAGEEKEEEESERRSTKMAKDFRGWCSYQPNPPVPVRF